MTTHPSRPPGWILDETCVVIDPPPYPRVPRLPADQDFGDDLVLTTADTGRLLQQPVVVEEKLDGTNVSLWAQRGIVASALRSGSTGMDRGNQLDDCFRLTARDWAARWCRWVSDAEHRSARIRPCVNEERRRRWPRCAAWAFKIRRQFGSSHLEMRPKRRV